MNSNLWGFLCFLISLTACNYNENGKKVGRAFYEDTKQIDLSFLFNIDLFRRDNTIELVHYFNDNVSVKYVYDLDHSKILYSDSLANHDYKINKYINFCCLDVLEEASFITCYIEFLEKKIKSYQLKEINHSFYQLKIDAIFYFHTGEKLFYIEDYNQVENSNWITFLSSIERLDDHWFYESGVPPQE